MQPNGSGHTHSNEASLRSSQEVRPQVRVSNVAHVGSKGKCGSSNTAQELKHSSQATAPGPSEAPCCPVSQSGQQCHIRTDPAAQPRSRGAAAEPFGVIREGSLAVWKGASRPPATSTKTVLPLLLTGNSLLEITSTDLTSHFSYLHHNSSSNFSLA